MTEIACIRPMFSFLTVQNYTVGPSDPTWANTQFNVTGNSNTVNVTTGDVAGVLGGGNTINAAANTEIEIGDTNGNFDTVNANGDVVGGTDVLGVPTGIYLIKNAQVNLFGSSNTVGLDTGDSFGAYGGGNEIHVTSGDFVVAGQTNGVYDNIYGSNDLSGGTSDNGQLGTGIVVEEGAQASLIGSNNSVNLGTGGTLGLVSGTGNTVNGSGATINALSGVGATINGYGNTLVATGSADAFNLSGGADSVTLGSGSAVRLLDGSGYRISGSNNLFATNGNTGLNLAGTNNTVIMASGDTLAVLGGGNKIVGAPNTAVFVGGTNGSPDAINVNGDQAGGVTADGRGAGIVLLSDSEATIVGGNNNITVEQDSVLGAFGDNNRVLSGVNGNVAINGNNNNVVSIAGGQDIFVGTGNSATVNGTAVYPVDGNYVAVTGTPSNAMALQAAIAGSPQVANDIDEVYLEVLGRGVDPSGLTGAQSLLAAGGTLAGLRTSLAGSAEAFDDMRATYAAIGISDGPTSTELAGFKAQMSASYDAPITVYGYDYQKTFVLANTSATNLLAELPVLETLDNGRTLSLGLADGSNLQFTDTARLADFLYAIAAQKSQADTFVTDTYHEDIKWLDQVGQPLLNVAENFEDLATYNTLNPFPGSADQVTISHAAARIALQIAAEAPGTRGQISEKVSLPGHVNQVTVFADTHDPYGGATYHDIDPGIGGILETVSVAVITLAAVISGQPKLYYVAAAADAAEAGKDFANGDILGGILQLASAAGSFEIGLGGANPLNSATQTGKIILTAAQGVGGVYGAVQSAENGDALGVLAGALEATAAVASGIGRYDPSVVAFTDKISAGLGAASIALSTTDAFASGNLAGGLISSLSAVVYHLASQYNSEEEETFHSVFDEPGIDSSEFDGQFTNPQIYGANITPVSLAVTDMDPTHGVVPFRGSSAVVRALNSYVDVNAPYLHGYTTVVAVGTFADDNATINAATIAESDMRRAPAAGIQLDHELGPTPEKGIVKVPFAPFLTVGTIQSNYDPESGSVINVTTMDHIFDRGIVVRQISVVDHTVYVTTLGEGNNANGLLAAINGYAGSSTAAFAGVDSVIATHLSTLPGYAGIQPVQGATPSYVLIRPSEYIPF